MPCICRTKTAMKSRHVTQTAWVHRTSDFKLTCGCCMFINLARLPSLHKTHIQFCVPVRGRNPQLKKLGVKIRTTESWVISRKKTVSQKPKQGETRKSPEPQSWKSSVWETELASHRHQWDRGGVMLRVSKALAHWSYRRLSLGRGCSSPGGWVWGTGER